MAQHVLLQTLNRPLLQILIVMGMLVRIIGWAPALAGLMVTVAIIPLSAVIGKALSVARREMVAQTDDRVKLASEVITGEVQGFMFRG